MNKQAQRSRPDGPEDEDIQATGKRVRTISEMKEEQKKDRFDRSQDLPPMEEILLGVRRIEVDSQPSGDEVFDEIDGNTYKCQIPSKSTTHTLENLALVTF